MNFYSPVSNTKCHSIGHKMRIARIKIRVDSPGRWEKSLGRESNFEEVCFILYVLWYMSGFWVAGCPSTTNILD